MDEMNLKESLDLIETNLKSLMKFCDDLKDSYENVYIYIDKLKKRLKSEVEFNRLDEEEIQCIIYELKCFENEILDDHSNYYYGFLDEFQKLRDKLNYFELDIAFTGLNLLK